MLGCSTTCSSYPSLLGLKIREGPGCGSPSHSFYVYGLPRLRRRRSDGRLSQFGWLDCHHRVQKIANPHANGRFRAPRLASFSGPHGCGGSDRYGFAALEAIDHLMPDSSELTPQSSINRPRLMSQPCCTDLPLLRKLLENIVISDNCLVAGSGIEPPTYGL